MLILLASPSFAQDPAVPEINAQIFHSSVDGNIGFGVDDAHKAPNRYASARVLLHYINDPLVFQYEGGERVQLLSDLLLVDVLAGYTIGRVRAGIDFPLYLVTAGDDLEGGVTTGDLALDLKINALDPVDFPLGLAVTGRLLLPTGSNKVPVGSAGPGYEIGLAGSQTIGEDWRLAVNLGHRGLPAAELENVQWGSQFMFRAGVARELGEKAGLGLELDGAFVYDDFLQNSSANPVEGMLSGWYRVHPSAVARLGLGTGLTRGIGSPIARVIASIAFEPLEVQDRDGDGIVDPDDACIDIPEDVDTFQDEDGCPDPDNDKDGIADVADKCVMLAEDLDSFDDGDGCPDPDNDLDGVIDRDDDCPDVPEDNDGWKDDDGCAEPTEVQVRVLDASGALVPGGSILLGDKKGGAALVAELAVGSYKLAASAPAYIGIADVIVVKDGPPMIVDRKLAPEPTTGTLELRVTGPKGEPLSVTWRMDTEPAVVLEGGRTSARLLAGSHAVDVYAAGYASTTQKVSITKSQTTVLAIVLQPSKVVITAAKLDILDKIYFDTGKTTIKKISLPLLNEIARVLKDHPELKKVSIEGHTDSRGNDASNLKLSDGRSKAVQAYLVKQGVSAERLVAAGFGETRPVDPAETETAWEMNRRVEFVITERGPQP